MRLQRPGWGIFAPLAFQACLVGVLVGCPAPTPDPKPPVVPVEDGGFPVVQTDSGDDEDPSLDAALFPVCVKACATLKVQQCPEAQRLPGGKTCYAICRDEQQRGKINLKPECIAKASSVSEIRACGTVRCQK